VHFDRTQAHILYFSGTGNTAFIAEELRSALSRHGIEAAAEPWETADFSAVSSADLLLFGFPVYGARMPRFLRNRIRELPKPRSGRLFLFATYGLYSGNALRTAAIRFARRGFLPAGAAEFKLPGSDGLAFLKKDSKHARRASETDFREQSRIRERVELLAEAAATVLSSAGSAGSRQSPGEHAGGEPEAGYIADLSVYRRRSGLADLLLKTALAAMRKTIRRRFCADGNCTRCGLCVRICPSGNISLPPEPFGQHGPENGLPVFGDRCVLCMRCVHQCPEEAIQIGSRTRGRFRWKGPDGSFRPPRIR
jgi:ferredoxin